MYYYGMKLLTKVRAFWDLLSVLLLREFEPFVVVVPDLLKASLSIEKPCQAP